MSKLPVISSKKVVKILLKLSYVFDHQTGSHMIFRHKKAPFNRVVVPKHKELTKGTLLSIIKQSGLSKSEFLKLLK